MVSRSRVSGGRGPSSPGRFQSSFILQRSAEFFSPGYDAGGTGTRLPGGGPHFPSGTRVGDPLITGFCKFNFDCLCSYPRGGSGWGDRRGHEGVD